MEGEWEDVGVEGGASGRAVEIKGSSHTDSSLFTVMALLLLIIPSVLSLSALIQVHGVFLLTAFLYLTTK